MVLETTEAPDAGQYPSILHILGLVKDYFLESSDFLNQLNVLYEDDLNPSERLMLEEYLASNKVRTLGDVVRRFDALHAAHEQNQKSEGKPKVDCSEATTLLPIGTRITANYKRAIYALQHVIENSPAAGLAAIEAIGYIREKQELPSQDTFDKIVTEALRDPRYDPDLEDRFFLANLVTIVEDYEDCPME